MIWAIKLGILVLILDLDFWNLSFFSKQEK